MLYDNAFVAAKLRKWETYLRGFTLPTWEELPNFEIYMNQVVALLSQYLDFLPAEENADTVVTASAINNYVRMKIMPAPNKKKYSRVHIAYLIMICTLKQSVNIAYVQKMIPMGIPEERVMEIYNNYVVRHKRVALYFIEQVRALGGEVLHPEKESDVAVENFVVTSTVVSGFSKLMAEKIVRLQGITSPEPDAPSPEDPPSKG